MVMNFSDSQNPYVLPEILFGDSSNPNVVHQPIFLQVFQPEIKIEERILL